MPRTARAAVGGLCYHVLNRGNGRAEVFHKPEDFDAFVGLFAAARARLPMRILGEEKVSGSQEPFLDQVADGKWLERSANGAFHFV